jgi:hypothetical protein
MGISNALLSWLDICLPSPLLPLLHPKSKCGHAWKGSLGTGRVTVRPFPKGAMHTVSTVMPKGF